MTSKITLRASRTPTPASEYRVGGGRTGERMVASNGEINAFDKADLKHKNWQLIAAKHAGEVDLDENVNRTQLVARNRMLLQAAFNDPTEHRLLGNKMADAIYATCNRQGFLRKVLAYQELQQGQVPRFPVRGKNVTAMYSTSSTQVQAQIVRDKWFYPPEIDIIARPFVPEKEINQSADDVLTEKFVEGQEAIMVAEDRLLYNASNAVVNLENEQTVMSSAMTPYTFMTVVDKVTRWGLAGHIALMASDLMRDIIGNEEWMKAIEPVSRHELLMTGTLGVLYGINLVTDAYRHLEHKVLSRGEFFIYADPVNTGAYTDRGGLRSQPIDISTEKIAGRGWVIQEPFSMALANPRAVAKGIRLG